MWFPQLSETFVFRSSADATKAVVLIVPDAMQPQGVIIGGVTYDYDDEATEKTRMYLRVHQRGPGESAE